MRRPEPEAHAHAWDGYIHGQRERHEGRSRCCRHGSCGCRTCYCFHHGNLSCGCRASLCCRPGSCGCRTPLCSPVQALQKMQVPSGFRQHLHRRRLVQNQQRSLGLARANTGSAHLALHPLHRGSNLGTASCLQTPHAIRGALLLLGHRGASGCPGSSGRLLAPPQQRQPPRPLRARRRPLLLLA